MTKIIWALFSSSSGDYQKALENEPCEIFPIGLNTDGEKLDEVFSCDLSRNFSEIKKDLDRLPRPDFIFASPPCESWSTACRFSDGHAHWRSQEIETIFGKLNCGCWGIPTKIRALRHGEEMKINKYKNTRTRINGELCAWNTAKIIEYFKPETFVIENPSGSKIWKYFDEVVELKIPYLNEATYSAYDVENFSMKPTKFGSNKRLDLKKERVESKILISSNNAKTKKGRKIISSYTKRSEIPHSLIRDIFEQIKKGEKND